MANPLTPEIKAWHRNKLKIDLDIDYGQGIVTMTRAGSMYRVSWKCDDATYKIGNDRRLWYGYDSFQEQASAERAFMGVVEIMKGYGLTPEIVR